MKKSRPILRLLACTLTLCTGSALPGQDDSPQISQQQIGERIARLDDRQFPVREKASAELSRAGISAIDELAAAYLEGTTEQRWRILKILEQVSFDTEEEGFYQIAAVLRVLGGHQYGPPQISGLHRKWQTGKSARAAQRLRDAGAKIVTDDGLNSFGNAINLNAMMMGNNRAIGGQGIVVFGAERVPLDLSGPPATGMLDPEIETGVMTIPATRVEKQEMLDDIFQSDIDSNRRIAIAALQVVEPDESATDDGKTVFQYRLNNTNVQPIQNRFDPFDEFPSNGYPAPVSISFGPEWTGSLEQMADVSAVSGLSSIEFNDRPEVLASELVMVARIPELRVLSILNCRVDAQTVALLADMTRLNTVVLDLNNIDDGWLDAVASLPELMRVCLIAPPGGKVQLHGMERLQSLRHLSLQGMQIDSGIFGLLQESPFLSTLYLQNCRFDLSEFRAFKSTRPQLDVTAAGNSFLGVRAPSLIGDLPGFTCRISEVVVGSAAEIAGIMPGDLVRKIEGYEIHAFQDLVLVISQKQPGDSVSMEIEREGNILQLTAKLGDKADAPPQ